MTKSIVKMGMFVALAMIFSYIEVLIPFQFGIPGVKLGIANIVIVTGLYWMSAREVFLVSIVRILLMGLLFGNSVSLLYSLAGGLLSFAVMILCKKTGVFTICGVSIAGGVFHNVGQILMAAVVLHNSRILYYLPVLIGAGVLTGAMIGILCGRLVQVIHIQKHKS